MTNIPNIFILELMSKKILIIAKHNWLILLFRIYILNMSDFGQL